MRKETTNIAKAFRAGKPAKEARTATDGQKVWLHGNLIAERRVDSTGEHIVLTLAGWNTVTTRDRVNGIAQMLGLPVQFFQRKHDAWVREMVNGQVEEYEIDPSDRMMWPIVKA